MAFVLGLSLILNIILIITLASRKTDKTNKESIKSQEIKELVNDKFDLVIKAMKEGFDVTDRNFNKLGKSLSVIEKDISFIRSNVIGSHANKHKETSSIEEECDERDNKRKSKNRTMFVDHYIEDNINKSKEFSDNVYMMFKHEPDDKFNDFLTYGMLYKVVKFCKEIETYVESKLGKKDKKFLDLILKTKGYDMEDLIMVDRMYGEDKYGNETHLYSYVISNFENHDRMYKCYFDIREIIFKEVKEMVDHNKGLMGPMNND